MYCRVSSVGQMDGFGIPEQQRLCRAWARANGHRVIALEPEVFTGKVEERPVLGDAVRLVQHHEVDGLLIPRLDRIARQLTVQEAVLGMVWSLGGRVFAADQGEILQDDPDDPMRTAMRQMQGVFAQLDRAMLTKRMRDGIRAKRAEGRHATGTYPYGYRGHRAGRKVDAGPDELEQRAVARILELRAAEASYREIAAALDAEGLAPRKANRWSAMAVRNIYLRESARTSR